MKTKPESTDRWDMADYQAANTSLLSQIVVCEVQLHARGIAVPSRPAYDAQDAVAANDALNTHLALLKAKGSNSTATASVASKSPAAKQSLTERILAARGVTKISDLPLPKVD